MTDNNSDGSARRTVLKALGISGVALAGASAPGAAHPHGNGQGNGNSQGNAQDEGDEEDEQEQQPGYGQGQWCCSCAFAPQGRRGGPGYRRGYPHERDETEWDDWEPGDGRPPWAEGDGEDDDDEEEEPEDPEEPPEEDDGSGEDGDDTTEDPAEGDDGTDEDTDTDLGEPDESDGTEETPEDETDDSTDADGQGDDETTPDDTGDDTTDVDGGDAPDESTDGDGTNDGEDTTDSSEDTSEDTDAPDGPDDGEAPDVTTQIEDRIHALVNDYREDQGEEPLEFDDDLAAVAREHSQDMAEDDYFSHVSPDGEGPGDRLDDAGIDCYAWGENIARESSSAVQEEDAESVANSVSSGWINSSGHRENILGAYDSEGVGAFVNDGEIHVTQIFCSDN